MLSLVSNDLEDQEHDRKVRAGDLTEDTRFLSEDRPCPMPQACRWDGRVCRTCGKKKGIHSETVRLMQLGMAMRGGMPMQRSDLSFAQWQALGRVRAEMEPKL